GRWLLHLPGRWLAPLSLALCAFLRVGVHFAWQLSQAEHGVVAQESRRLYDRLVFEQIRMLPLLEEGDDEKIRSKVAAMPGLDRAYLVGADGVVQASLSEQDIGQVWAKMSSGFARSEGAERLQAGGGTHSVQVRANVARTALLGRIGLGQDRMLIVQRGIVPAMTARQVQLRKETWREALILLAGVGLLAWVLHLAWFRRAKRLVDMLAAMAADLDPRAEPVGGDELAFIGAEANRLADRLRQEQAQLRRVNDLVRRSPVVVIEWMNAPGWPVSYVSESVEQWGYTREDLLQARRQYNDLIHPDDLRRINPDIDIYLAHGPDNYQMDYRLLRKDGRWAWVDDRTTLTRDADGEIVTISGVLLDITVQKEAQFAQQQQAQLLQMFYDLPFIGMAITSPQTKHWLQVNDRLCEILGYPRAELLQLTWSEITPPGDLERNVALFDALMGGEGDGYRMQKRFTRKDGRIVHTEIDVKAVRNSDGSIRHLLTTVEDITEGLLAKQAIEEHKAFLEQAETMARLGSWSFDVPSQQLWWSAQMYENVGLDPAQGVPSPQAYLACLHPDDRQSVAAFMQGMAQGEHVKAADFRTNPERGAVRWLRGTVQERTVPGSTALRYSGTLLDVTPIKEAEAELWRINEELEQRVNRRTLQLSLANQELETFSYSVSHDLKAPLRGIDGYSALLEEEYAAQLGDEGLEFVGRIRQGVNQMGLLITDLLAYSRMERQALSTQELDLKPLVETLVDQYRSDLDRAGTQVSLKLDDLTVHGDREGLSVVLRNLIGNAIKFSARSIPPTIEIGACLQGEQVRMWVRDNGVGFDMKYHDRMFGIFQRLHGPEQYPGTGVGLALVAKAVQRMGGRVWAEGELGQGSTFLMEFPV
ncbi:PAS domain S-box protein, partial [Hydrogenophaga sp.]|uniref:PAS domain S-box protein n=1 Tax=Hydrogenophaga sp. TaxID=1904254 RepID=UPI00356B49C1